MPATTAPTSLETIDVSRELDQDVLLDSPRSLQACLSCGVDPRTDLKYLSLKHFASLPGEFAAQLAWGRFERHSEKRRALILRLKSVRQQIIEAAKSNVAAHESTQQSGAVADSKHETAEVPRGYVLLSASQAHRRDRAAAVLERKRQLDNMAEQRAAALAARTPSAPRSQSVATPTAASRSAGVAIDRVQQMQEQRELSQAREREQSVRRAETARHSKQHHLDCVSQDAWNKNRDREIRAASLRTAINAHTAAHQSQQVGLAQREARAESETRNAVAQQRAEHEEQVRVRVALMDEQREARRSALQQNDRPRTAATLRVGAVSKVDDRIAAVRQRKAAIDSAVQALTAGSANKRRASPPKQTRLEIEMQKDMDRERLLDRQVQALRRRRAIAYLETISAYNH